MSSKIRMALIGLALVVFAALVWFFVLSPIRSDIAATNTQIEEQRTRLATAQVKLAQAEATRQEGRRNQARLLELAKMMPTSEELPSLLLQIQNLADKSGIEFIAITPGDTEESKFADGRILPLALEFSGTFFNVSDFVYQAEHMAAGPGRLLAIKTLDLELAQGAEGETTAGSPELAVAVTMYAFLAGGGASTAAPAQPATTTGTGDTTSTPAATEQ